MQTLKTNFTKYGENFRQVDRDGDVAIFERSKDGETKGFEVIRVRKYPEYEIAGTKVAAHEAFPPDEAWGEEGWYYRVEDKALAETRFLEQVLANPTTQVIGTPTGEQRGRKRSEFEIELPASGEFRIKELHAKYPDKSVPFLHLRVKELINQKRVEFVRSEKIEGQRGKPTSVFRVVPLNAIPKSLK